jgi:hypothetical protein
VSGTLTTVTSFDPGIASMKAAGVSVTVGEYADGAEGIDQSIAAMSQKMREGRNDHRVRRWALETLSAAGIDGRGNESVKEKAQVLLDAFRAKTSYSADPVGTEFVPSAAATLCLDPALCVKGDDCFPAGTLLLRGDKKRVPIEDIKVGDYIWGRDLWTRVEAVVSKGVLRVDRIELADDDLYLRLTNDHHVFAVRQGPGFALGMDERIRVSELSPGDLLIRPRNDPRPKRARVGRPPFTEVKSIVRDAGSTSCWDIQTSDHYVYLPEHDVTVSNCDGLSTALGAVMLSIGIPTVIVKQEFGYGQQQHVLIAVEDENGQWLYADPSTRMPVGSAAHATREERFDPMDTASKTTGTAGNEIVTLGRPMQIIEGEFEEIVSHLGQPDRRDHYTLAAPAATAFDQAQIDLANQVMGPLYAGEADMAASPPDYAAAVTAFQAGGQTGASSLGPEIDLAGAWWVTQPLTGRAWQTNVQLAAITPAGATLEQAELAQAYLRHMVSLYQQAINDGITALTTGQRPPSHGTPITRALGWAFGLGAAVGVGYVLLRPTKRRS